MKYVKISIATGEDEDDDEDEDEGGGYYNFSHIRQIIYKRIFLFLL